jgi:hypothetical protein
VVAEEPELPRHDKEPAPQKKEAPPAPVVPVLGKNAKAKKKRREG